LKRRETAAAPEGTAAVYIQISLSPAVSRPE
jgi:hypothetical protein